MTIRVVAAVILCGMVILPIFRVEAAPPASDAKSGKFWVFVGTYTQGASKGIYKLEFDASIGKLTPRGLAGEAVNPSFLAIHPSRRYLFAVSEVSTLNGKKTGGVSAFSLDPKTGDLKLLNQQSSGGEGPCHIVVDKQGKNVLVANYGSGSAASLPLEEDGKLREAATVVQHKGSSVDKGRQEGPHAHSINLDSANRFAFVADLGLDHVKVYRFGAEKGTLAPNDPAYVAVEPGAGPRHFAFHPDGKHAYVINEMQLTVTAFDYDSEHGVLKPIQSISTLPKGYEGKGLSTAEVQVHPSGKFLYGSNRGQNSIAIFTIDQASGKLTHVGNQGDQIKTPRNFGIDPTGQYLIAANQDGDSLVVFKIDQETGDLKPTGQKVEVPMPVCVKFMPMSE
jgi:6-phosphogluconolactonase